MLVFGDTFILPQDLQKCELACYKTFLGWGKYFLLQVPALVSFLCGGCWADLCSQKGSCKAPADHGQECPANVGLPPGAAVSLLGKEAPCIWLLLEAASPYLWHKAVRKYVS